VGRQAAHSSDRRKASISLHPRVLERLIGERGRPENLRSDSGPEFTSRRMLGWAEDWKVGLVHSKRPILPSGMTSS